MDRRQALSGGQELPDRTEGAALFADISGFTPLTQGLTAELGRARGAEALLEAINPALEALVTALHRYRGSVISFAGDAITCWLDGDDGRRALACGLAMQAAMQPFATLRTPGGRETPLRVKIGIAAGPVRRFLVGDPRIQVYEALAGETLERMASAEGCAKPGEVLACPEIVERLGPLVQVSEWRGPTNQKAANHYAVIASLAGEINADPWPELPAGSLTDEQIRPWVAAPVYERLRFKPGEQAGFLAEFRPVSALFLQFGGVDYDRDDRAGEKLDAFTRWTQAVLQRTDGYLHSLIIGDKGSYLLAAYGAPVAHDDDPQRAVAAALELRRPPAEFAFITPPRLGVSQGLAWAGACGGAQRSVYTILGDEVTTAARLMAKALPGQVLVLKRLAEATQNQFLYRDIGALTLKGKAASVPAAEALARRETSDALQQRLPGRAVGAASETGQLETGATTRLVGRQALLAALQACLDAAAAPGESRAGQVVRLEGPAGIGKSVLAAAFVAQARTAGWQTASGACASPGQGAPYDAWRQTLLQLVATSAEAGPAGLQTALLNTNPAWEARLPLLGDLFGQALPENPMTAGLEPRLRQAALFALLGDIFRAWAASQPLLLVIDDAHWMDEASRALTLAVGRSLVDSPAMLLVCHRPPPDPEQPILPELDELASYHRLSVEELAPAALAELLAQHLGAPLTPLALMLIAARSLGNPFFAEELAGTMRDGGQLQMQNGHWELAPAAFNALLDAGCLEKQAGEWQITAQPAIAAAALDLPDSVNAAVLARLDRLPDPYKLTLKTASVIGPAFDLELLAAIHPRRPQPAELEAEMALLGQRDFIRQDASGPAAMYLFRHNTTQEAVYCSLLYAQRRRLHRQVAEWHEQRYAPGLPPGELSLESPLAPYYSQLAHHWREAEVPERERIYAGLAGEQVAKKFANESAVRFFSRALDLTPETDLDARYRLLTGREATLDILSDRPAQQHDLELLQTIAQASHDPAWQAAVCLRQARLADLTGEYAQAMQAAQTAARLAESCNNDPLGARALHQWGRLLWKQGQPEQSRMVLEQALELAQRAGSSLDIGRCYDGIATSYREQVNFPAALNYYGRAQDAYQTAGYRQGEISILVNMGAIQDESGQYIAARQAYQRALALSQAIGWRAVEAYCLGNLGSNAFDLGDYTAARAWHEQALAVNRNTGSRYAEALNLDTLGLVFIFQHNYSTAVQYARQALAIQEHLNDLRGQGYTCNHLGLAYAGLGENGLAHQHFDQALAIRREQGNNPLTLDDLAGLARLALSAGDNATALVHVDGILASAERGVDGTEFPAWVYLTCWQVLRAAGETERAQQVLEAGQMLVLERAGQIADIELRQSFLQQVPFNRDLLAAESAAPA